MYKKIIMSSFGSIWSDNKYAIGNIIRCGKCIPILQAMNFSRPKYYLKSIDTTVGDISLIILLLAVFSLMLYRFDYFLDSLNMP
jgi:hypothetical protein